MFRMWGKMMKENRMVKDVVACIDDCSLSRTTKVFQSLEKICYQMDLEVPIWLDATIQDFKRHSKARFTQDSFIQHLDADYLEIQVIEE